MPVCVGEGPDAVVAVFVLVEVDEVEVVLVVGGGAPLSHSTQ